MRNRAPEASDSSLFPGGDVRLLTSAPDWAFTGPNQLPTFPGPGDPATIDTAASAESLAIPPTGQPGTPELHTENTKEIVAPEPDEQLALEPIQTLQLEGDDINDEMNEDSNLTGSPEIQRSPEIEDFQEPEIELPLPVIVALQEREARKEFAGAARTEEFTGAPSSAPYAEDGSIRTSRSRRSDEDISLSHHAARCSICQHPDREAIEQGFLHWESPTLLAYEYGLGQRRAIYRHARAHGLFEKRGARTRRSLEFVIEQAETVTATADSLIRAVRAYSCVSEDGRWTEPTKRVIITHEHSHASSVQSDDDRAETATLGDGHAVPSKNAVTPAPPTKVEKLMDTLFSRFSRPKPPQKEKSRAALKTAALR